MPVSLFGDVLLETTPRERRRRRLTLAATLAGEALAVAALAAIPLLYLDAVPGISVHAAAFNQLLTPAPLGDPAGHHDSGGHPQHTVPTISPGPVTHSIPLLQFGPSHPRPGGGDDNDAPGDAAPWGCQTCVPNSIGNYIGAAPPRPLPPPPHTPLISHVDEGMILHRVDPVYPHVAREARIQGEVIVRAVISKDGDVESLRAISGHPLLAQAALDAVAQWHFRPYRLNGAPVAVEAQITVHFRLDNN